ncbi:MAG: MFS transporter [Actinomycetota bacterium]|nr:MFS transporter [Actinomycetota bacterium]
MGDVSAGSGESPERAYRRDRLTWAAFSGLLAFGFLNAALGPALPYIRGVEHISYLVGALHQVAFAVGGGLAGLLTIRAEGRFGRGVTIRLGLAGAAIAGLGVGYGGAVVITVLAAFLMSLFGTLALIRMWAALADAHGARRTVAMAEGEVSVSLGGIVTPLLVGGFAATALTWRFAFVTGGAIVGAAVLAMGAVRVPGPALRPPPRPRSASTHSHRSLPAPTLVVVFAIVGLEFSLSFWLASYLNDSIGLSRGLSVVMVSGLYTANLAGRLLASRLARHTTTELLLAGSLIVGLAGLPILLATSDPTVAALGVALAGLGVGAMFPLTSSLHVAVSSRNADGAIGQVLAMASIGQILGPLTVGAIAQTAGLRDGLLILPALVLLAAAALARHYSQTLDHRSSSQTNTARPDL